MDISPNKENNNKHYLINMSASLAETDKIVVLLIDEIYISARLDYRAKNIVGSGLLPIRRMQSSQRQFCHS